MAAKKKATIKDRIDIMLPTTPPQRFAKRSGATTAAEHDARKALVRRLIERGQLNLLEQLRKDEVSWEELRQADRDKRLSNDELGADIALARRLWNDEHPEHGEFAATLSKMGKPGSAGIQTRKRYELVFAQLRTYGAEAGLSASSEVRHLATVNWDALWVAMRELSPASRNHIRRGVSAFLTQFLGNKHHPYRHKVCKAMGRNEDATAAARDIEPESEWPALMGALDETVVPTALVLGFTGLRIAEYLQLEEEHIARLPLIMIPGTNETTCVPEGYEKIARQAIPCRLAPAPARPDGVYPGVQYDARYKRIYKAFKAASAATGIACTPHYLRHLFAAIGVEEANEIHTQHALRHKTPGMTAMYAKRRNTQNVSNKVGRVLALAAGVSPDGKRRPAKRKKAS